MLGRTIAAVLALGIALPAVAQGIPKAQSPEEVGFVATRLKRLSERIEEGVKNNELPGAVVLIVRNGKIVMFDAFGFRDKEAKAPMKTDAIFRIASMTKPIVSVAAMILVEEGRMTLADPVSKHIPAFAETKVSVQKKNPDGTVELALEPQFRPMTVQDLMRHTSGLTYGAAGSNPVKQSYVDMKVMAADQTNAQMAEKLAKFALLSRKTIDLMTADHLPPEVTMGDDMWRFEALEPSKRMGQGFGLGFAVRNDQGRNPLPGSPGDYYWGGAYGTYFWHDPREHLYVVFMMQSQ